MHVHVFVCPPVFPVLLKKKLQLHLWRNHGLLYVGACHSSTSPADPFTLFTPAHNLATPSHLNWPGAITPRLCGLKTARQAACKFDQHAAVLTSFLLGVQQQVEVQKE